MVRLLVVDKDAASRGMVRARLTDRGYSITTAGDVHLGVELARRGGFEAILVGSSPAARGPAICARLRGPAELAETPVVVYAPVEEGPQEARRCYDAGARLYVPASENTLLEHMLAGVLRSEKKTSELLWRRRMLLLEQEQLHGAAQRAGDPPDEGRGPAGGTIEDTVSRPAAAGHPDALLGVDERGVVRWSDRGAWTMLGSRVEEANLADLAPLSGLDELVRGTRRAPRGGHRLDLGEGDRPARRIVASVYPLEGSGAAPGSTRLVILNDVGKRGVARNLLHDQEAGLPLELASPLIEAGKLAYGLDCLEVPADEMADLRRRITQRLGDRDPVLLLGRRGSRRWLLARCLHYSCPDPGVFFEQRCGALSTEALRLELFEQDGLVRKAAGGTLYLADVDDLAVELQGFLLEMLGEEQDVRLVASAAVDLVQLAEEGRFLPELAERLWAGRLEVPAEELASDPLVEDGDPWAVTEEDPISFEVYEKKAIMRALDACDGDRLAAAELLEVGKSTLYRKIRLHGIR